jgi:hypothetical protein
VVDEYLGQMAQLGQCMDQDQAEIDRLTAETRDLLTQLKAA